MIYRVEHKTEYRYQDEMPLCHNEACLIPRDSPTQRCRSGELWINPLPAQFQQRKDFFGNKVNYFSIQTPHKKMTVTAISRIEITHPGLLPLPRNSPPWENVRDNLPQDNSSAGLEARLYLLDSPYISGNPELHDYTAVSFPPNRPILDAVRELNTRIYEDFQYDPGFSTVITPLTEVFKHRRGVCQDFAHLAIACLRGMGLAARYVSGYIETLPPPGQEKLQGADASHAWFSLYVPGSGWTDFDPTNNQIAAGQHITTAWGRDYSDVIPLKGVIFGGGPHTLSVSVDVKRLGE